MDLAFQGGDKLRAHLADLAALAGKARSVRVGFLEGGSAGGANHPQKKGAKSPPKPTKIMPAPQVAFWLEYGTKYMPPRPFFRNMIEACSPAWGEELWQIAAAAQFDPNVTMDRMGQHIRDQLKASILGFTTPDIKQSTKDAKGFDTPLRDSENMLNSVSYDMSLE